MSFSTGGQGIGGGWYGPGAYQGGQTRQPSGWPTGGPSWNFGAGTWVGNTPTGGQTQVSWSTSGENPIWGGGGNFSPSPTFGGGGSPTYGGSPSPTYGGGGSPAGSPIGTPAASPGAGSPAPSPGGSPTPYGGTTGSPLAPAGALDPQGFPSPAGGGMTPTTRRSGGGGGGGGGPTGGGSGSGAKPQPLTAPQQQQLSQLRQLASANQATATQLRQLAALVTQQRAAAAVAPIRYAGATRYGAPAYAAGGTPGGGYGTPAGYGTQPRGGTAPIAAGLSGLMVPLIIGGVVIALAMGHRAHG